MTTSMNINSSGTTSTSSKLLPEGAVILSSSATTHYLPNGSSTIEETIEYVDKDGQKATISTSITKQGGGGIKMKSLGSSREDQPGVVVAAVIPIVEDEPNTTPPAGNDTLDPNDTDTPCDEDDPITIRVLLHRNQDYNAIIQYAGSRAGTVSTYNRVYVLVTNPSEIPFPVCYQSDLLLAFTKAHIEEYATYARMYTKEAWAVLDVCRKEASCRSMWVFSGGLVGALTGFGIFMVNVVDISSCDDKYLSSSEEDCSGPIFETIMGVLITVVGLLIYCYRKSLAPGTVAHIYKKLGIKEEPSIKISDYSFELAHP